MKEVISKKEMGVSRYSSFILGLLFLVIQGCAGVGPDLEKAKEQNTEQAYLAFIEKYQDQSAATNKSYPSKVFFFWASVNLIRIIAFRASLICSLAAD